MSVALAAGLLVGAGLWVAWSGLRPAPEALGVALARLEHRPAAVEATVGDAGAERDIRLGRFLLRHVAPLSRAVERVEADLRVLGRTPEEHAARVGSYVLLFLVVGPWLAFISWTTSLSVPSFVPPMVLVFGVAWGLVVPFTRLRSEAQARRQGFSHALSAWCDVVVMTLAAGRGPEQAMETAASAGQGWAFAELRGALRAGYVRGETPWEALTRLGTELGVRDLSELGNTIAMAGEEGAAVRTTVSAKARTIRERISAEVEATAAATTERMSLPSVGLVMGFLVFLGYPAVDAVFGMAA